MKYRIVGENLLYNIGSGEKSLLLSLFISYMKDSVHNNEIFLEPYATLYNLIKENHPELFL